jgi:hypothetical protein
VAIISAEDNTIIGSGITPQDAITAAEKKASKTHSCFSSLLIT